VKNLKKKMEADGGLENGEKDISEKLANSNAPELCSMHSNRK
jgi:hypothetical protein